MKWEYLQEIASVNEVIDTDEMDEIGKEGWELVTICSALAGDNLLYVFKRPRL